MHTGAGKSSNIDSFPGRSVTLIPTRKHCYRPWKTTAGCHVPSDSEWQILEDYLIANGYNYDGTTSGNKIAKSMSTAINWDSHTREGSVGNSDYPEYRNKSCFSGLPAGYRFSDAGPEYLGYVFEDLGYKSNWWTRTQHPVTASMSWGRYFSSYSNQLGHNYAGKNFGFSVRCIKD